MKIIVGAGKTSRAIEGPYKLCASRTDFETLQRCIASWLRGEGSYGWADICEKISLPANTPPEPWEGESGG